MDDLLDGPLNVLWREIGRFSHQEHPFLAPQYSPNSRMPCSDFTSFIADRMKNGDTHPVKMLMKFIAGAGFVMSDRWMDGIIDDVAAVQLERYFHADSEKAYYEIKALFILAAKSGGDIRSILTDDDVFAVIVMAISCYNFHETAQLSDLASLANEFIKKNSAIDASGYWGSFPAFPDNLGEIRNIEMSDTLLKIRSLPIGCRLGLITLYRTGRLDMFPVRSFGSFGKQTSSHLLDAGLIKPIISSGALQKVCSKDELLGYCQQHGVAVRKTWTKATIAELLFQEKQDFCHKICLERSSFTVAERCLDVLDRMLVRDQSLAILLGLIVFAFPSDR